MLYRENGQFKSSYAADQQLLPIAQDRWFVVGLIAFAYLAMPVLASDYMFRALIIPFVILAIAAIGLNILVGYCGQISIGQAAFMAVGAYAAYNLVIRVPQLNFLIVLVLAGGIAALVGALFGIPSLRIKGLYLAVSTLAAQSIGCSRESSGLPTTRHRVRCRLHRSNSLAGRSPRRSTNTCSCCRSPSC